MRKKRKKRRIVLLFLEIIVLLVLLAGAYVYFKVDKVQQGEEIVVEDLGIDEEVQEEVKSLGYTNIALFGLDNRSNGSYSAGNSDVIIIASINNDTQEVKLVSVYRDTYLNLGNMEDGTDYAKCNEAFQDGGVNQALRMIDQNLDLDITQYVCFDFNAVAECVDLMGGVEVDVDAEEARLMIGYMDEISEMTGKESPYLQGAGTYNLDGVQATAYARVRYTSGSDYKRTERQRLIIEKLFEKAKTSDLATLNSLVDTMLGYIETNLSTTDIIALASKAASYSIADTTGFPFELTNADVHKQDCVIPCDLVTNVQELHSYLFANETYTPSETVQNISNDIVYITGLDKENATITTEDTNTMNNTTDGTDSTTADAAGTTTP